MCGHQGSLVAPRVWSEERGRRSDEKETYSSWTKWFSILEMWDVSQFADPSRCDRLEPKLPAYPVLFEVPACWFSPEDRIRVRNEPSTPLLFTFVFLIEFQSNCNCITFHSYLVKK